MIAMLTWEIVEHFAPLVAKPNAVRMWKIRGVPYKTRLAIIAWARETRRSIRVEEFDALPLRKPRKRNGGAK